MSPEAALLCQICVLGSLREDLSHLFVSIPPEVVLSVFVAVADAVRQIPELGSNLCLRDGVMPVGIDFVFVEIWRHTLIIGRIIAVETEGPDDLFLTLNSPGPKSPAQLLVARVGSSHGCGFELDQHHEEGLLDPLRLDQQAVFAAEGLLPTHSRFADAFVVTNPTLLASGAETPMAGDCYFPVMMMVAVPIDVSDDMTHYRSYFSCYGD